MKIIGFILIYLLATTACAALYKFIFQAGTPEVYTWRKCFRLAAVGMGCVFVFIGSFLLILHFFIA